MARGKKTLNCSVCGDEFSSYNINPQFCSQSCRTTDLRHAIDEEEMISLYERGLSQGEVADALRTTQKVVWKRMKCLGYRARVASKRNQRGKNNDNWNGGRTVDRLGYIRISAPGHPRASVCGGYVSEHTLVVEDNIGRYLEGDEIVHHINGIKNNNRPSNLFITNPSEHSTMHGNGWSYKVLSNLNDPKEWGRYY